MDFPDPAGGCDGDQAVGTDHYGVAAAWWDAVDLGFVRILKVKGVIITHHVRH